MCIIYINIYVYHIYLLEVLHSRSTFCFYCLGLSLKSSISCIIELNSVVHSETILRKTVKFSPYFVLVQQSASTGRLN